MDSGISCTQLNDMLTDFVDYVDSFYGLNDPIWPMFTKDKGLPLSKRDIYAATADYLSKCSDDSEELCTWGDGDSLDRERVRDILLADYNYEIKD